VDQSPQWRPLILAAVLLGAFLAAVSLNIDRLRGWSFVLLCVIAVLLGAAGYIWARDRVLPAWERLPRARRLLLVVLAAAIVLAARLIANQHKPNEQIADVIAGIGILFALTLYWVVSRLSNSSRIRTSRR
jgi:hypothetical protein